MSAIVIAVTEKSQLVKPKHSGIQHQSLRVQLCMLFVHQNQLFHTY